MRVAGKLNLIYYQHLGMSFPLLLSNQDVVLQYSSLIQIGRVEKTIQPPFPQQSLQNDS